MHKSIIIASIRNNNMKKKYKYLFYLLFYCLISVVSGLLMGHSQTAFNRFNRLLDCDLTNLPSNCSILQRDRLCILNNNHIYWLENEWPTSKYKQLKNDSNDVDINKSIPQWKDLVNLFIDLPVDYIEKDSLGNIVAKINDRHCTYEFVKVVSDVDNNRYINYTKINNDWVYTKDCSESIYHEEI